MTQWKFSSVFQGQELKKKKKKTYLQSGEVFNLQTGNIFKRYYSGENIDFHPWEMERKAEIFG